MNQSVPTYNAGALSKIQPMFKKSADIPINLPINREPLGEG
jgi:hypothetical protein